MRRRLINRRQFLTRTGSTLALGAMSGVLSPSVARTAAPAEGTTGEVLVIGAGLAGLAAAYELDKAGFGVTVVEAREPFLEINPETARALGVGENEWVFLEMTNGGVRLKAKINRFLHVSVVATQHGWWEGCEELALPGYDPLSPSGATPSAERWRIAPKGVVSGRRAFQPRFETAVKPSKLLG